jgi:hypothetical protein
MMQARQAMVIGAGARAFFGEVDPVRRQKCGKQKTRVDST